MPCSGPSWPLPSPLPVTPSGMPAGTQQRLQPPATRRLTSQSCSAYWTQHLIWMPSRSSYRLCGPLPPLYPCLSLLNYSIEPQRAHLCRCTAHPHSPRSQAAPKARCTPGPVTSVQLSSLPGDSGKPLQLSWQCPSPSFTPQGQPHGFPSTSSPCHPAGGLLHLDQGNFLFPLSPRP